jgi:hypothetical protein
MVDLRHDLARRLSALGGVAESESMFGNGTGYWVNGKEVAHFEADAVIEVRLTKAVIRDRRDQLKGDPRIHLRPSGADWVTVRFDSRRDLAFVVDLVQIAEEHHRPPPGVAAKPPPTGADLARRRRFH